MRKKLLLISGLSGAGKSSTTTILEDLGYHCIDQYPVQLIDFLIDLLESTNDPKYSKVAITIPLQDYNLFSHGLKGGLLDVRTLILEANDEVLLRRYKSTRRTHPLLLGNISNTLEESIAIELEYLSNIKDNYMTVIDTSHLSYNELRSKIIEQFADDNDAKFSITFLSFGYKHGVPLDADLMIDVRFLPNPFWEESLKLYSGDDENVYNYVMDKPETDEFLKMFEPFLDYSLNKYYLEGKNHLTVGIGCTGGQHRSVSITNYLFNKYKGIYKCFKAHRDKVDYYEK